MNGGGEVEEDGGEDVQVSGAPRVASQASTRKPRRGRGRWRETELEVGEAGGLTRGGRRRQTSRCRS